MSKKPTYEELEQQVRELTRAESKRKHAEEIQLEYKERLALLVEQTRAYIWAVDADGLYIDLGPSAEEILGYRTEEIIGKMHFYELHPDNGQAAFKSAAFEVFDRRESFRGLRNRIQTMTGEIIWVNTSGIPILDAEGSLTGYWGMDIDITDHKRAEDALRESEIKHKTLVNNIPGMVYRAFPDWSAEIVSGCKKISGYTNAELNFKEKNWLNITHPDDREQIFNEGSVLAKGPKDLVQTYRIITKGGKIQWVADHKTSVFSKEGDFIGIDGIVFNITEHKQAEKALRESEEKYRHLFETAMVGIYRTRIEDGKFLEANQALAEILGYETIDRLVEEYITPTHYSDPKIHEELLIRLQSHGRVDSFEIEMMRTDGSTIQIVLSATAYPDQGYLEGFIVDITERKKTEKELLELYKAMDLAQTMAGIGYWNYDKRTEKRMWSSQMYKNFGMDPALGHPRLEDIKKVFHPEDRDVYDKNIQNALRGIPYDQVAKIIFPDGKTHYVHTQGHPKTNEASDIIGLLGTSQDITERILAEKALQESEEQYRRIFENSVVGFFQSTPGGHFIRVNSAFAKMLDYESPEELLTKITNIEAQYYVSPKDRRRYQEILHQVGHIENYEFKVKRKDGSQIWVSNSTRADFDENGKVAHYEGMVVDINQRKKAEKEKEALQAQLQQTQKFEAIGTLAGGVAHDFNNLLMGIQGRAPLMSADLEPFHSHLEHTNAIEDYIRSATDLTKQLLGLARGGKYEVKPIDTNDLVRNSAKMFGRTKKEIRIHTNFQDPPPVVSVDRSQIEQVLLNLYINAWQAMSGGGDLYLETQIATLDDAYCKPYKVRSGHYAKVSVTDTGIGMDSDTRQRIFDPFFTTKEKGRGTGLGLASAYGIIKNHDGIIMVYSEVGHGTTFNIYLPLSDKEAYREVPTKGKLIKGSETVLLVDDEEMILEVGQAMLEKLGYRIVVADGGKQAVNVVKRKGDKIDLVILDLIMPGMDGGKVFDHIKEILPQIPVILSSGYAINGQAEEIMQRGCNGFIQKPFNISELSQKVRIILDEAKKST